jgi:hypothetical protein
MKKANYRVNLAPTLHKLLEMVRDDVMEMDCEKLASDKHTILVAKADVVQIINDWIVYCLEEWPPIEKRRKAKKRE